MDLPPRNAGHCRALVVALQCDGAGINGACRRFPRVVADVDAMAERAAQAGATVLTAAGKPIDGHRACRILDPYGHLWMLSTVVEDLSDEELLRRVEEMYAGGEA